MEREFTIIIAMFAVTMIMSYMINFLAVPILCNYSGNWIVSSGTVQTTYANINYAVATNDCPIKMAVAPTNLFWDLNAAPNMVNPKNFEMTAGTTPSTSTGFFELANRNSGCHWRICRKHS